MRKLFASIVPMTVGILFTASMFAQSPEKMSYQAVIRDASNNLVTSTSVGMKISILQGSTSGSAVYIETQIPTTNANGLVSIEIGAGTLINGDFTNIDWANGPYFIRTETDPTGGTSYSISGTSQLLSVTYALHAKTSESVSGTINETDPVFGASVASGITGTDTAYWNNKLDSYTETDPSVPTGTAAGDMQYWNGTAWVTIPTTANEGATLQMIGGVPTWTGGTPPTLTPNVTNPTTGEIWMDRNLGASQVATSSTDADSYGDLYQWGRGADGHQIRTSGITTTLATSDTPGHGNFITSTSSPYDWRSPQNTNLWQGVSGTNNPCPIGYRLPTEAEWNAERTSWSSNNAAGAFASPLKLPVAGYRLYSNGSLDYVDSGGVYWSSTVSGTCARFLSFDSSFTYMDCANRAYGFSVRCIKDGTPSTTVPTLNTTNVSSVTETSAASGGNITGDGGATVTARGICWSTSQNPTTADNTTSDGTGTGTFTSNLTGLTANTIYYLRAYATNSEGTAYGNLVSFTTLAVIGGTIVVDVTNPITGEIWMDRNLGASQVATSNTDTAAYGDLYQWGRAADGHESRTSGTTLTLATSDTPGHGNFIVDGGFPCDWRNPQNDNLWQGVSGTNNPCPSGYRLPTQAEWEAERTSWSSNNSAGASASPLKLPVAGYRFGSNGSLDTVAVGSSGYYWSSTPINTDAMYLYFDSSFAHSLFFYNRSFGFSVRCIKD